MSQVDLKIDYCSYEAAKYAVEHWHYSKCLPGAGSIKFGVWENDVFIGCVIYSRGANKNINRPYGLDSNEVCELARVALNKHKSNVSQIVSYTIRKIKKDFKNMKLIVSYADSDKGHIGKIYQAMNFIYEGLFAKESGIIVNGKLTHRRSVNSKYGTSSLEILKKKFHLNNLAVITGGGKHKYLMPLNNKIKEKILCISKKYPKCTTSETIDTVDYPVNKGGETPTVVLQTA